MADSDLPIMGSWLLIASRGNPLPPDKYKTLEEHGLVLNGAITEAGYAAMKQFWDLFAAS